jgi:hypothetical protein
LIQVSHDACCLDFAAKHRGGECRIENHDLSLLGESQVMAQGSTQGDSSSSSLSWIMVAAICAMALLFGAGILVSARVFSSMAAPKGGSSLTVHTRTADLRLEKPSEVGPGLPLYPHASLLLSGTNTGAVLPHAKHADSQLTNYYTEDVPPLVDSWYLQHLGSEFVRHTVGEAQAPRELDEVSASSDSISFLGKRGDQVRVVTLTSNSAGTIITLLRFTSAPAN